MSGLIDSSWNRTKSTYVKSQFAKSPEELNKIITSKKEEEIKDIEILNYIDYLKNIPSNYESSAIKEILLKTLTKCPTNKWVFLNVSSQDSLDEIHKMVDSFKETPSIFCSTAAHYLFFSASEILNSETIFKCNPPILSKENQAKLLDSLSKDKINVITSSHFPTDTELKNTNFIKAIPGASTLG